MPLLVELGNAHPDARFDLFQWWTHPACRAVPAEAVGPAAAARQLVGKLPVHRVGPVPAGEKLLVNLSRTANAAATRAGLGDGSYGGAYQAPDTAMERFFAAAVDGAMVAALRAF